MPQCDTDQVFLSIHLLICPLSLGSPLGGWEILDHIGWLVPAPEQQLCPDLSLSPRHLRRNYSQIREPAN